MDRIATLRRIESALSDLEGGETDLAECEQRIRAAVRTFATELDGELSAYRSDTGTIVLAASEREARDRIRELTDNPAPTVESIN
jgi:N-formylglutamate amidohydrolase